MQLSTSLPFNLMITKWASILNPIISIPFLSGRQINNIILTANTPFSINHGLQRLPQGWFVVDNQMNCTVWRTQPFNQSTLFLESNANTIISIWVY
jgi:hypothetical protein